MKMSKYFSDAQESANTNFNSFNGSEFLNANGSAGGSSAGLGGATSQPYVLQVANTTTDPINNVNLFQAYKSLSAGATNFDIPTGITVTIGVGSLTYVELLYQSMNKPFVVGLTYISSTAAQVLETIKIVQKDINGNESTKNIVPTIDPYQQQSTAVAIAFNYKIDGFTKLEFAKVAASTTVSLYLYPAENVATGRALTGGAVVKGFQNPDVVKKDRVEIVSSPGSRPAPMAGRAMSRRSSRGRNRRF
jgi:hypothetical protein